MRQSSEIDKIANKVLQDTVRALKKAADETQRGLTSASDHAILELKEATEEAVDTMLEVVFCRHSRRAPEQARGPRPRLSSSPLAGEGSTSSGSASTWS